MDIPRIVIAGTNSKVGKTMISIGLMRALVNRGYVVQPYKIGPDFIDPGFHHIATGRYSRNLDSFMLDKYSLIETFQKNFRNADIAIIEGKTGLYDSADAISEKGSTAEVCKILKAPVLLVANAERINRTIAAILLGYKLFDPEVDIKGVILNRVGNRRHAEKVKNATEKLAKLKVYGIIPREKIDMPYRHLGLIPAYEREVDELLDKLANLIERYVNIDEIVDTAYKAPPIEYYEIEREEKHKPMIKIGVIRDRVFSFYYQDNIDELSNYAEIVYIDSLKDKKLPKIDALYIGGGFPEVFAEELEKNSKLRNEIYEFCEENGVVYAECGGLMYLGKSIVINGEEYEMVGFLPIKTEMHNRFQAQGYCIYKTEKSCIIARKNETVVGHEFHYSKVIPLKELDFVFKVKRGYGVNGEHDGITKKNVLANYIHVHFLSNKNVVKRFVNYVKKFKKD